MRTLVSAVLAMWCVTASAEPATRYVVRSATVTGLRTLAGPDSEAHDINDSGVIVGWAQVPGGARHAFLLSGALGEDIGAVIAPKYESIASGINNKGQVVGSYRDSLDEYTEHPRAFRWVAGDVDEFGTRGADAIEDRDPICGPSARGTVLLAINEAGVMAGLLTCGWQAAARWRDPSLPEFADYVPFWWGSRAFDINASNVLVGWHNEYYEPVIWRWETDWVNRQVIPLPAGSRLRPQIERMAINDEGAVAFTLSTKETSVTRAALWAGGTTTAVDLGVLAGGVNSGANDLNEERFVAGWADVPNIIGGKPVGMRGVAFIYHADFGMYELPILAPPTSPNRDRSCHANAINERDSVHNGVQLVGWCYTDNGAKQAVRWDVEVRRVSVLPPDDRP